MTFHHATMLLNITTSHQLVKYVEFAHILVKA